MSQVIRCKIFVTFIHTYTIQNKNIYIALTHKLNLVRNIRKRTWMVNNVGYSGGFQFAEENVWVDQKSQRAKWYLQKTQTKAKVKTRNNHDEATLSWLFKLLSKYVNMKRRKYKFSLKWVCINKYGRFLSVLRTFAFYVDSLARTLDTFVSRSWQKYCHTCIHQIEITVFVCFMLVLLLLLFECAENRFHLHLYK